MGSGILKLKQKSHLIFIVLLSTFILVGISAAEEDIQILGVEWEVEGEAERLAEELLSTQALAEAKETIKQILYRLGVGVYDYRGRPVVIGNERSKDDFWLYEYQVDLMAKAFMRKQYTPLKLQVENWDLYREAGHFSPADTVITDDGELDSRKLEMILRNLRLQAEEEPDNSRWFLIRLFDALGDREEYPFDLLEDPEAEDENQINGLGAAYKEIMEEELKSEMDKARQDAGKSGDTKTLDMLSEMEDGGNMDALMEAAMKGDISGMMGAFVEEEELDEIWGSLEEVYQEGQETEPEMVKSMEASKALLGELLKMRDGGDLRRFSESAFNTARENRDSIKSLLQSRKEDMKKQSAQNRAELPLDATAIALQGFNEVEAQSSFLDMEWSLQIAEHTYDKFAARMEEVEQQNNELEEMEKMFGSLPLDFEEEEEESQLRLDPVQNFLLHLDIFSPRFTDDYSYGNSILNYLCLSNILGSRVSASDPCSVIGEFYGQHKDLFGVLRSIILKGVGDVTGIISGFIETLGIVITAEVEYSSGEDHIHMRHGSERDDDRELIIKPKVEYIFDHGEAVVGCGPLLGIDLPPEGPMEDIPVRFYPSDLLKHTYVHNNWYTIRPTYTNRTDEKGIARGHFYPKLEDPDLGGVVRTEEIEVELVGVPIPDSGVIYSISSWGINVGRELFSPVNTSIPVKIKYHEPTPLKGMVEIRRTLLVTSTVEVDEPRLRGEARDVKYTRDEIWDLTITFDEVEFDREGNGNGSYSAKLEASSLEYDKIRKIAVFCTEEGAASTSPSDAPVNKILEVRTFQKGEADGTVFDRGTMWLDVHDRHDSYRLQIEPLLANVRAKLAQPGRFSGSLDITVEETDCEGGPRPREAGSSNIGFENIPQIIFQPIAIPEEKWVTFDRDAERLSDFIYYPVNLRSLDGKVLYEMTTEIEWKLDRVF